MIPTTTPLLSVQDLSVEVPGTSVPVEIVSDVSFDLHPGKTMGLVGESGSGKSLTAKSILGMLDGARISKGTIHFGDRDLGAMNAQQLRRIRGNEIGMVFQEPMTALDPTFTVGEQIAETIRAHTGTSTKESWQLAVEALDRVHIPSAKSRAREHPHNFSGGMRQRVVIAMALCCQPQVLLADEPTTALDVTTQAQILSLFRELQDDSGLAILFISHDLGVIADICDDVSVMYAGQIIEQAEVFELFRDPIHHYTKALMDCVPRGPGIPLEPIPGSVPDFADIGIGCRFADRCPAVQQDCREDDILLAVQNGRHPARCIHPRTPEVA